MPTTDLPEPTEIINGTDATHYYWRAADGSGLQVHARVVDPAAGGPLASAVTALQCPQNCREVLAEFPGVSREAIEELLATYTPKVAAPSFPLPTPRVPLPA